MHSCRSSDGVIEVLRLLAALGVLVTLSACSNFDGDGVDRGPALGEVGDAWEEAAQCIEEAGHSVEIDAVDERWTISIEGLPTGSAEFAEVHDPCVSEAEELSRHYERTHVAVGAQLPKLAKSFDICIESIGLDPLTYDVRMADQVAALAEVTAELGYSLEDGSVANDPRFSRALGCFESHERLFPGRFAG